ncbi:MAG: hypothetical protein HOM55_02425 [Proteobacteria bacterium]|jgi:hypothetical protein|nr:hypothetical protein [Pseudomonadota bacterium]
MKKRNKIHALTATLLVLIILNVAKAGDVEILAADFKRSNNKQWSVNVTLAHADSGWGHYADDWWVVDADGNILGDRVLLHPHENEHPFTRSLSGVKIPEGTTIVYIEAHDIVHGCSPNRLTIDLGKASNGRLRVRAE